MSSIIEKVKGKAAPLKEGSRLPTVGTLKEDSPMEGSVDLAQLKGKNIIVAVPGAFSPTCSDQVPGYIEEADKFAAKGVQGIYVVAVNDAFTTKAWKSKLGGDNTPLVHFLADDEAKFTKAAGLDFDATAFFGNHRSQRYAAVVEDGVVKHIFVEKAPTDVTVSSATSVLQALG